MPDGAMEVSVQLSGSGVIAQHTEGSKAFPQLAAALEDEGQAAAAMEKARGEVAALFGARPGQVVFTSGGAESSNAAVKGLALALLRRGAPSRRLLLSEVEHAPVIHSALGLELVGFQVVKLGVGRCGRLDLEHFSRVLEAGGSMLALQWANEETGLLQPMEEAVRLAAQHGVPVVVDATAAAGWVPIDFLALPIAALSISSRCMGGPPGVGALLLRNEGAGWQPLIQGGVQEGGQRAGRLHPALVAALGLTAAAASRHLVARARAAEQLRKDLLEACSRRISGLMTPFQGADRLPGHLLMMIPGVEGESLLADLRRDGIEADSGSSCMDGPGVTSRVLRASGLSQDEARSSLILRLSSSLSRGVVEAVAGSLATSVARLRALAP